MTDNLRLTDWLARWPSGPVFGPDDFDAPPFRRLASAIAAIGEGGGQVGTGDLAGLIRTVLMHERARTGAEHLIVSAAPPFPAAAEWSDFGVRVVGRPDDRLKIAATPWRPAWLDLAGEGSVDERAYDPGDLRTPVDIQADPCLSELMGPTYTTYRSPGQAMAVRWQFLADHGTTILVNLPTGQGKSLVFQSYARQANRRGRLSVLVVPTTALAKDHERRFHDEGWASVPLAYYGGLSDADRTEFKQRIRDGRQPIVISSPEALLGSLRRPLAERARAGALAQFIVDEAHMLQQWGVEFRPSYQFVPAFRDLLVEVSPEGTAPKTLLLSATVSGTTLETLTRLFGRISQVSAVHIRPEPEFWVRRAADPSEKQRLVAEAIRYLPRPFILYTCTRDHARELYRLVRERGINRVRKVVGGTRLDEILAAWQRRDVDVVVATSAFGLGVDNNEVRAVLHACVPETVDRFYQEIGRSGRDGRGSISLTVYADSDWETARALSRNRTITPEIGWLRWDYMWVRRTDDGSGRYLLDLSLARPGLPGPNRQNEKWNQRTLSLMARSGIIRLRADIPEIPESVAGDDEAFQQALRDAYSQFPIELLNPAAANNQEVWTDLVQEERERARERESADWRRLQAVLTGRRAMNETFAETYATGAIQLESGPGRCPVTRRSGTARTVYDLPCPVAPTLGSSRLDPFPGGATDCTYVSYDSSTADWDDVVQAVVEKAVGAGYLEVVLPPSLCRTDWVKQLHHRRGFVMITDLDGPEGSSYSGNRHRLNVPQVVLVPPGRRSDQVPGHFLRPGDGVPTVPHLVLFEQSMEIPDQPGWLFGDQVPVYADARDFLRLID